MKKFTLGLYTCTVEGDVCTIRHKRGTQCNPSAQQMQDIKNNAFGGLAYAMEKFEPSAPVVLKERKLYRVATPTTHTATVKEPSYPNHETDRNRLAVYRQASRLARECIQCCVLDSGSDKHSAYIKLLPQISAKLISFVKRLEDHQGDLQYRMITSTTENNEIVTSMLEAVVSAVVDEMNWYQGTPGYCHVLTLLTEEISRVFFQVDMVPTCINEPSVSVPESKSIERRLKDRK